MSAVMSEKVPRKERLDAWLKSNGITLKQIAEDYGCHPTYPGKMLRAESDEMPRKFRRFMLDTLGCPEDLLPPPGDKKEGTTRNQMRYRAQKEAQSDKRVQALLAERVNRPRRDIPLSVGV